MPFKKGEGGRPKGVPNKVTSEWREVMRSIVEDPGGLKNLREQYRAGTLPAALLVRMWEYTYGPPKKGGLDPAEALKLLASMLGVSTDELEGEGE